jgi:hypothetical protein
MIARNSTQTVMWLRMQCFAFMLFSLGSALLLPSVVGGQDVVPSQFIASDIEKQAAQPPLRPLESMPATRNAGIQRPIRDGVARATSANDVEEAAAAKVRQTGSTAPARQYEAIPLRQPDLKPDGDDKGFEFKTPDGVVRNTAISLGLVLGLFLVVASPLSYGTACGCGRSVGARAGLTKTTTSVDPYGAQALARLVHRAADAYPWGNQRSSPSGAVGLDVSVGSLRRHQPEFSTDYGAV